MSHTCHHPTCEVPVPPKMLACRVHWYQLPLEPRKAVWKTYTPGQESTKQPSQAYLEVIAHVQRYWRDAFRKEESEKN